jgi:hypothetical protein
VYDDKIAELTETARDAYTGVRQYGQQKWAREVARLLDALGRCPEHVRAAVAKELKP